MPERADAWRPPDQPERPQHWHDARDFQHGLETREAVAARIDVDGMTYNAQYSSPIFGATGSQRQYDLFITFGLTGPFKQYGIPGE